MSRKSLHQMLSAPNLRTLLGRASQMQELTVFLESLLPEMYHGHFWAVSIVGECLTIIVDNAALASRLHMQIPDLIAAMARVWAYQQVRQIRISVSTNSFTPKDRGYARSAPPFSTASRRMIAETAELLAHDGLKAALYKLAASSARPTANETKDPS